MLNAKLILFKDVFLIQKEKKKMKNSKRFCFPRLNAIKCSLSINDFIHTANLNTKVESEANVLTTLTNRPSTAAFLFTNLRHAEKLIVGCAQRNSFCLQTQLYKAAVKNKIRLLCIAQDTT